MVHKLTVMAQGNGTVLKGIQKRLGIFNGASTGSCIAYMAYRNISAKLLQVFSRKNISNKPHVFAKTYLGSFRGRNIGIANSNAGAFLPSVLQSRKRKIRKPGCIICPKDSYNTTFIVKLVISHFTEPCP